MSFPLGTINLHLAFAHNKVREDYIFQIIMKYDIKYKKFLPRETNILNGYNFESWYPLCSEKLF